MDKEEMITEEQMDAFIVAMDIEQDDFPYLRDVAVTEGIKFRPISSYHAGGTLERIFRFPRNAGKGRSYGATVHRKLHRFLVKFEKDRKDMDREIV